MLRPAFILFRSHWITLVGVFGVVLGYAALLNWLTTSYNAGQALLAGAMLVVGYGVLCWAGFWGALLLLDAGLLLTTNPMRLLPRLLLEWALISTPFLYGAAAYGRSIFAVASAAFLGTQLLRNRWLRRALNIPR